MKPCDPYCFVNSSAGSLPCEFDTEMCIDYVRAVIKETNLADVIWPQFALFILNPAAVSCSTPLGLIRESMGGSVAIKKLFREIDCIC